MKFYLMRRLIPVFVFLILLFSTACLVKPHQPVGLWFYTYTPNSSADEDVEATPASFLYLRADGTYTRDFKNFDYGHWNIHDTFLVLTNEKLEIVTFPIKKHVINELELVSAKGSLLDFEEQPAKFSSDADNPFSIENNRWRIKATQKESDQEIKQRLQNHFKFNEAYFKWALDDNLSSIDVRSTPSLLKIYGNGFALKEFNDLPAGWKSCFYDDEDCRKANDIIKNVFEKQDISWARTDNRYKMFISAFQQLERFMQ